MAQTNNSHQTILAIMNRAEKAFDEAKYTLSILYYSQAIAQMGCSNTHLAYALYMRGCAYKEKGCIEKAYKEWEKAQDIGFEHPLLGINLITLTLAS